MRRKGFTLIELLTVITVIGLLATIATVSYDSSRAKARDAKRLADLDVVRQGLELYVNGAGGYPVDAIPGVGGTVLGSDEANTLIDTGWANHHSLVYIERVPPNPGPFGAPYVYESLNADDSPCNVGPCNSYRVSFYLESPIAGLQPGPYTVSAQGVKPATGAVADAVTARTVVSGNAAVVRGFGPAFQALDQARSVTIDNPTVERAAETIVAPVSTAAVVATAATAISFGQFGAYFYLIFTQPFLLLRKRKEYSWGVVYNSQSKLPIDLAIIRLIEDATGRVVQTRVTDSLGRLFFFAPKGVYRIEVKKNGFDFPSEALKGATEDGKYGSLYLGQRFTVGEQGAAINPSIPLDPSGTEVADKVAIVRFLKKKFQHGMALSGFFLTLGSFIAKPSTLLGALLGVHLVLYFLFRRLSYPRQSAQWGIVSDEKSRRPIGHAVVRLFSLPYHKLVETHVADRRGRYNFMVGQNMYYVTVTHPGYWKTESFPLDLRAAERPQVIAAPVGLRPLTEAAAGVDAEGKNQ